jgi:hypothetical protein
MCVTGNQAKYGGLTKGSCYQSQCQETDSDDVLLLECEDGSG